MTDFAKLDSDTQQELRDRLPQKLWERAARHLINGIDLDTAQGYDSVLEGALWSMQ